MVNVVTSYNNFSRGRIDHDMQGRFDLPIYSTGSDWFDNFISNFKGNAIYRTGFEFLLTLEDCEFIEFKFNNQQSYICVFTAGKIRFLSYDINGNFGWVLDGAMNILEVANPYTLAECKQLDWTQNFDAMIITHNNHEPRKLFRVSSNSFTFNTYARVNDPFATYAATVNITGITQAANALVTTGTAHGLTVGQRVKFAGVVGMTQINGQTGTVLTTPTGTTFTVSINTSSYSAWTSGGTIARILTSDYPACCLYYKGRLYFANTPTMTTTIWASRSGLYDDFTTTPVDNQSGLKFTLTDIAQPIEWLFPGDNSLIVGAADGIVPVNGGSVGSPITASTIEGNVSSAEGCNTSYPIKKDGLIFYVSLTNRNMNYFSYDLLSETFKAEDANFVSYDITEGGIKRIRHKKDRNDLIFSVCNDNLLTLNFNQKENVIGWHRHTTQGDFITQAVIPDNTGTPQLFCLVRRFGVYYLERQAEYVEFVRRIDFFSGVNRKDQDDEAYNRMVAEQLKQCIYLDNSQTVSNLKAISITYNPGTGQITALSNAFSNADIGKSIVYKTKTGYESGRFKITGYTSPTVVTVQVIQQPTANTYDSWYLTFQTISGLSQYIGQTVGVVTDGGYLKDFEITSSTLDLGKQVTHAVIGYRYKGLIKSFCLGFQAGGQNTQTYIKGIFRVGLRFTTTAGGQFGTSPYKMTHIQELGQNEINYLPPIPIDGTKYITYSDDMDQDKYYYLSQDLPLPMNAGAVIIYANYSG